ncbi:unnamed protein product, partial [Prorocentrum cordatum]
HVRAKPKFAAVPLALRGVLFGAGLSAAAPRECIRRDGRPPLRRDPRAGAERRAVRVGGTRGGVWRERREGTRSTDACAPGRRGPEAQSLGSGAPPHLCSRRQAAMKRCHLDPQEVRRQRLGGLRRT